MDRNEEQRLARAGTAVDRAVQKRDQMIVASYEAGESLRAVAKAVGLAYPSVRHIVLRDRGTLERKEAPPPA